MGDTTKTGQLQLVRCCHSNKRGNMADKYRKFSSSSSLCEDWKMTRYISGISIIRFASFLAWTGLVTSLIFILGSLDMIFTPLALGIHRNSRGCGRYYEVFCGSLYGVGAAVLLLNIGMFIYSFKLWKAISSDNMMGMRNLIKIGCYIMGGLELLSIAAAGVVTPILFIIYELSAFYRYDELSIGLLTIPILISGAYIALISLMIHGVRKFKPGLVNIYIIFKIVIFTLFAILTLVQFIMGLIFIGALGWMLGINMFLICGFFYFYSSGFMVVQYNIMLGRHTEQGSLDLTHSRLQFSNNVYFNDGNTINANNLA